MTLLFFLFIIILAFIATPIFSLISALSFYLFYKAGIDSSATIIEFLRIQSLPSLITIPLFTFSGYVLASSKAPERMLNFSKSIFGTIRGGIAIASLIAAAIFTAFTGASGVTIIALGGLIYPILRNNGYSKEFFTRACHDNWQSGSVVPPFTANNTLFHSWKTGFEYAVQSCTRAWNIFDYIAFPLFFLHGKKLDIKN